MKQRGFTLIELMILLVILGLLATVCIVMARPKEAHSAEPADPRIPVFVINQQNVGPWNGSSVGTPMGTDIAIDLRRPQADTITKYLDVDYLRSLRLEAALDEILAALTFDFDSAEVEVQWDAALDKVALLLRLNPEILLSLEGHTDLVGEDPYNFQLGYERADAVRQALISRGVEADRLGVISHGEHDPILITMDKVEVNRRVEILPYGSFTPYPR